jgi:hypothetical protein
VALLTLQVYGAITKMDVTRDRNGNIAHTPQTAVELNLVQDILSPKLLSEHPCKIRHGSVHTYRTICVEAFH